MSKAVMISIHPKWCELIASGKKTVEVRKTKPNAILPLKCYIYQTKGAKENPIVTNNGGETFHILEIGKVIGEFFCHNIFPIWPGYKDGDDCLTFEEQEAYLGTNGLGWGWRISDLVIYERPKSILSFRRWVGWAESDKLTRPPQSWCYVEELHDAY